MAVWKTAERTSGMNDDDGLRLGRYIEQAAERGETRLPSEPRLSEALNISRGRLRTLLQRLEAQGRIWRHVGKGTFIGNRPALLDDQEWAAAISIGDIVDARILLEPQLAAQAAMHATPADIAVMRKSLTDMASAGGYSEWKRQDETLHRAIAQATHNALLLMLYESLRAQARLGLDARIERVFGQAGAPRATVEVEHLAIVDAIAAHDPLLAEQSMRSHLQSVRTRMFAPR